jgi:hypothetical protein
MHLSHARTRALRASPLLVTFLLSCPCLADPATADLQEPRHFIDTGLGPGLYQIADDIARGLRWRGPSVEIDGAFRFATPTDRQEAFLRIGAAYLEDRYDHAAVAVSHHMGYGFSRWVRGAGRWGTVFLGGQAREDVDLQYYMDWDEEHA